MQKSNSLEIYKICVRLLFEQSQFAQLGSLSAAIVFVISVWNSLPTGTVLGWFSLYLIFQFWRFFFSRGFFHTLPGAMSYSTTIIWEYKIAAIVFVNGLFWGVATSILVPYGLTENAFFSFLISAITVGVGIGFASSLMTIRCFLFGLYLPYFLRLPYDGTTVTLCKAATLVAFFLMFNGLGKRVNGYIVESIRLRFDKNLLLEELRETQAKATYLAEMAVLGELASGVSHEINNPMTIIQGHVNAVTKLVRAETIDRESILNRFEKIHSAISRVAAIISSLRAFSPSEGIKTVEATSLAGIIEKTLHLCGERFKQNNIDLELKKSEMDVVIQCRSSEILQVLLNLLNNSFDALEGTSHKWARIEVQDQAHSVILSVTDSGPGISPDLRDKIMQPFFTTKIVGKGAGLGLSASKGIAESHGGTLHLDESSQNTRFVLTLPKIAK